MKNDVHPHSRYKKISKTMTDQQVNLFSTPLDGNSLFVALFI